MSQMNFNPKPKFRWYIPSFFLLFLFITCVLYIYNLYSTLPNKMKFTYKMTNSENVGMLGIQSKELNSQTLLQGVLCVGQASEVVKVDLFMPDMGHGSSPPVLSKTKELPPALNVDSPNKVDYGCFNISKMEMFMPGLWQVRVFYKTAKPGIFNVNLAN